MTNPKRKFKKGDIVTFYESMQPWLVLGYKRNFGSGGYWVWIRKISLPSHPVKEVEGYAEGRDIILSNPILSERRAMGLVNPNWADTVIREDKNSTKQATRTKLRLIKGSGYRIKLGPRKYNKGDVPEHEFFPRP